MNISIVIKGIISILTVLVLSTTIYLSVEGIKLYKQKSYYLTKSNGGVSWLKILNLEEMDDALEDGSIIGKSIFL